MVRCASVPAFGPLHTGGTAGDGSVRETAAMSLGWPRRPEDENEVAAVEDQGVGCAAWLRWHRSTMTKKPSAVPAAQALLQHTPIRSA